MGEGRYQFGSVLIVRVNHDHNVGAPLQGSGVARLLVPAIAAVLRVDDGVQAETPGHLRGSIRGTVVHYDDFVDHVRDLGRGAFESLLGVVCRHDDNDSLSVDH